MLFVSFFFIKTNHIRIQDLKEKVNKTLYIHQSGVLILREKSVLFSFQFPKPTNSISLIFRASQKSEG